jgi:hypothetical protein
MHVSRFNRPLSRRHLLRGLGSVAIGLPLLEAMGCGSADPRESFGPSASRNGSHVELQRFIGVLIPNGVIPSTWFPTGTEHEFELAESMLPLPEYGLPGLSDFKDDLIVFRGIENVVGKRGDAAGHHAGIQSFLTGAELVTRDGETKLSQSDWWMSGPSIDQLLVDHWEAQIGAPFAQRSLHISGRNNRFSFDANLNAQPLRKNVKNLFDELFGLSQLSAEERERIRGERASVLDGVLSSYARLQGEVSRADNHRLEEHVEALRSLERRLDSAVECSVPTDVEFVQPSGGGEWDNLPQWAELMQDLLVLAFSCDITRAATFQCRDCGGGQSYLPWLDWGAYDPDGGSTYSEHEHHEMSHRYQNSADAERLSLAAQWFTGQTAKLLAKLRATPEGGGTLYDSVVLLQGSDIAVGGHAQTDMPFVVVGPGGGRIRGNRYVHFDEQVPHNRLLVAILHAMGMTDVTQIGPPDVNTGPMISLG